MIIARKMVVIQITEISSESFWGGHYPGWQLFGGNCPRTLKSLI